MQAMNWRKPENYKYLANLDSKGWAWEFIRRSPSYVSAFAEMKLMPNKECALKDRYFPDRLETDKSVNSWKLRVNDQLGMVAQMVTKAQYIARSRWMLSDLYDPSIRYDASLIGFLQSNPYPAFFADPAVALDQNMSGASTVFSVLKHPEDLFNGQLAGDSCVIVVFDMKQGIDTQIFKADKLLKSLSMHYKRQKSTTTLHRRDWVLMIRMLDALNSGQKIPLTSMLKIIDKSKAVQEAGSRDLSRAASRMKKRALTMSEEGVQGLIFNIQNA